MFRTILILSYLIPGLYIFIRIWQLFIPKGYRLRYVIIYALLFSVYPVSNMLSGKAETFLEAVANYLLPFFLYLFLSVLIIDLLLLINLILRIISRDLIRHQSFRSKILLIIICLSAAIVIGGIINFNTIRISEYKIEVPGNSSDINSLRIAFVSDFHLQESTPERFVERFVKEIEIINPDLMLFGGDIIEGDDDNETIHKFENLFVSIKTKYGVYGVLGNHEHYARQEEGSFFTKAGINIIIDSSVVFDGSFILAGRNDSHIRSRKSIHELISTIPDSLPVILLDHRPTEIDQVSRTHVDIQLSGHTHHGQLFPINLITNKVYELSYGYKKIRNTHFFVSSGIRLWGPPVRTIGKSEILVIDLTITDGK